MIDAAELARLARKYEALADLRRARARGEPVPAAAVFRALAREFPGCLNELDTLPLDLIDDRARALARAAAGDPVDPWMEQLSGYHALMRAALRIKPRLSRAEAIDDTRAEALARDASAHAGVVVDAAFVRAVAHPPRGRIVALVFAELSRIHGCPAADIKRALFPASRR
ncbi:MAG: hypothetical protein QM820_65670 [Minicystis sp.]